MPLILSRHLLSVTSVVPIGSSHQGLLWAYRIPMDFLTFFPSPCQPSHAICSRRLDLADLGLKCRISVVKWRALEFKGLQLFSFFFCRWVTLQADNLKNTIIMYLTFIYLFKWFFSTSQTCHMYVFQHAFVSVCVLKCVCVCTAQGLEDDLICLATQGNKELILGVRLIAWKQPLTSHFIFI